MSKSRNTQSLLKAFEQCLDVFGADARKWPEDQRAEFEALVSKDPRAGALLNEAAALDQVMAASVAPGASDDLKTRIVAAAVSGSDREARVVPISAARSGTSVPAAAHYNRSMWSAAALAASFAFGLYVGLSGIGGQTFDGALQLASLNTSGEAEDITWLDDAATSDTESLL